MLLAVDTSTQMIGIALYSGEKVMGELIWESHNHHTVTLAPAISELMKRCTVNPDQLKAVAVALGPGSFTSLRIGLALVKGLSLSLKLPIVGVPTLDILAAAQPVCELPLAAVLQIGRGRLALGWYQTSGGLWVPDGDASITTAEEMIKDLDKEILVCGELSSYERQILSRRKKMIKIASPVQSLRRPSYLAEIGWSRFQGKRTDNVETLAPIYLRTIKNISS